ncbi:MAG: hypothetical protein ACI8S6_002724 [Myxococcota bacterium]|jgi:hypothetical protein
MAETTFRLRVWTRYFESVAAVWAHKSAPERLAEDLRPWLRLRFAAEDERTLHAALLAGEPARAVGRLVPPGVAWPVDLVRAEPPLFFEDHSDNVLFSRFEHRHILEEAPDGCRYVDDVIFMPRGPSTKLSAIALKWVFIHRHRVAARRLRPDVRTVGTAVLRVLIEEDED